jgi:hypothetical protein
MEAEGAIATMIPLMVIDPAVAAPAFGAVYAVTMPQNCKGEVTVMTGETDMTVWLELVAAKPVPETLAVFGMIPEKTGLTIVVKKKAALPPAARGTPSVQVTVFVMPL